MQYFKKINEQGSGHLTHQKNHTKGGAFLNGVSYFCAVLEQNRSDAHDGEACNTGYNGKKDEILHKCQA